MELELLENKQTLNSRTLGIIINLNPCLAENETLLLSYYKRVRATWSNSAIKAVQKATGLKLTSKLNRCQFAIEAAKQELQFMQVESHEINCYVEGEELPVANNHIVEELPSITSFQSCGFVKGITLIWLNHLYLDSNRSIASLKRLLRQPVIRGHRRNDATLSLFVVRGATPQPSRRGQKTAHLEKNAVTAGQSVDTSWSKFKLSILGYYN